MPMYPILCGCGFAGDTFSRVADLDGDGRVSCPDCGQRAAQDYSRKRVANGNREFFGQTRESVTEGWHAREVGRVQREMAGDGFADSANCIQADGSVRFRNRQEQRRYMQAKASIWRRVSEGPGENLEEVRAKDAAKHAALAKKIAAKAARR